MQLRQEIDLQKRSGGGGGACSRELEGLNSIPASQGEREKGHRSRRGNYLGKEGPGEGIRHEGG